MTNLKDKIKNFGNWIKENPKKSVLGIGLAGLIATTALKDNVHFGSVALNNPQENQYVLGILPTTEIHGKNSKGNIYTFSLIGGKNALKSNSQITGNMNTHSLVAGINILKSNSQITGNMNAYGLVVGENILKYNSQITGNMNAYGLVVGENILGDNSKTTGNIFNRGLIVYNSLAGISLGSNDVKGLNGYVNQ